jgi:hypothetical protein
MKSDVDGDALQKVLGDLEIRLKAYLFEWQRQLGIQKQSESSNERKERSQTATEREQKGVETTTVQTVGAPVQTTRSSGGVNE